MASVRSTIELVITGATRGLNAASAEARRMAERVAEAEDRVSDARRRQAEASSRVAEAEARLNRARQSGNPNAIAAAAERLARARGQEFAASENLARAENNLNAVRRRGTDDMNRQRDGILGVFDAFGRLADAFSGADGASTSLLSKLGALHSLITSIGGPIVQAVVGILEIIAVMGALGEIVGVVGGLIGQALAGVPVLLFAIGAAAGTVMLGMDGIKKAAEQLKAPFEQLKTSVSAVFERQLTPAFRELARVIPTLAPGLNGVALAISGVIKNLVDLVARGTDGLANLKTAIGGTEAFVRGLTLGLTTFVSGFLNAVASAAPAMNRLGEAIGSVFGRIGEVFNRLANDGTIQRAITGLAATLAGLGDLIAPIIELFIRMGAALGGAVGSALSRLGAIVQTMTPFFEKLADVAGRILAAAFDQLGPSIERLFGGQIPAANQMLDDFANFIINTVLPRVREFIDWLAGPGIAGIKAFVLSATANFLEFTSTAIGAFSSILGIASDMFRTLALIPGPFQRQFAEAAAATDAFKQKLDGTKTTIDSMKDKVVKVQLQAQGEEIVKGMRGTIDGLRDKTVKVISNVFGKPENDKLKEAIDNVPSKAVNTTSTVAGEQANRTLKQAIDSVYTKTEKTLSNVFGEPENKSLKSAIDAVYAKAVDVRANVSGESAVRSLISAISNVVSKTVNIVANVIGNPFGQRASGGPVVAGGTYLVGERGPELLTIGKTGGYVTDASRTREILRGPGGQVAASSAPPAATGPMVIENHIEIGGEVVRVVRTEISARDRATRRTVLAGAGTTY